MNNIGIVIEYTLEISLHPFELKQVPRQVPEEREYYQGPTITQGTEVFLQNIKVTKEQRIQVLITLTKCHTVDHIRHSFLNNWSWIKWSLCVISEKLQGNWYNSYKLSTHTFGKFVKTHVILTSCVSWLDINH